MYKRQHGFSGHLGQLAALSSLPGDSPTASSALPATKSAPEKLLRTCRQDKTGAGKEEDEGGLAPTEDDDAASADFSRWQAYCLLYTEGMKAFDRAKRVRFLSDACTPRVRAAYRVSKERIPFEIRIHFCPPAPV